MVLSVGIDQDACERISDADVLSTNAILVWYIGMYEEDPPHR